MLTTLSGSTADDSASASAPPGLTVIYSSGLALAGQQRRLGPRAPLVVGRGEPVFGGLPLTDPKLSRGHATIARHAERYVIRDGGSRNGTFVNGERVLGPLGLAAGDVIQLGHTLLVFGELPARETSPQSPRLAGVGSAMCAVRQAIDLIAPTDHAVLLLGATGTGKELAAREVHERSGRRGEFVAVNCASLTGELLESQLFGHVRGAFTGATHQHDGLFRQADGGTLFLDEIGEMSEPLQARLLRVLQERAVRPVGGSRELPVSTRVIAATNRDVAASVRTGAFRADLYARLTEWTIHLPPLRKRREDLGVVVRELLARSGDVRSLDVDFKLMRALVTHRWPLNVRGLANVLTTARIAQPDADVLGLSRPVEQALADQESLLADGGEGAEPDKPAVTAERLCELLRLHDGNVAAAARDLGVARQHAYRLLGRWEIDPADFRP